MSADYYIQVIISLVVIGALLFGVYYFTRFIKMKKFSGDIVIRDRCTIDTGVSLVVFKVRNKEYLVGVSNKSITKIDEF